jgi:hypothetical protein
MTAAELKKLIGKHLIFEQMHPLQFSGGMKHVYETEEIDVVLLAVAKNTWAMVRRPGCLPFVVHMKYLSEAAKHV